MQIFVLGMHRSGTSVVTRLLNLMGAYFGPEDIGTPANEGNPKGYWERRDIRAVCDRLLQGAGADWWKLADFDTSQIPDEVRKEQLEAFANTLGDLNEHQPWVLKEPRMCVLFPVVRPLLERPVAVLVHREPIEIAQSLHRRNGFPIAAGVALWERYIRSALAVSADLPRVLVQHSEIMRNPAEAAMRLCADVAALGVTGLAMPATDDVEAFVSDDLYRNRSESPARAEFLTADQLELASALDNGTVLDLPAGEPSQPTRDVLGMFELSQVAATELPRLHEAENRVVELQANVEQTAAAAEKLRRWGDALTVELAAARTSARASRRRWKSAQARARRLRQQLDELQTRHKKLRQRRAVRVALRASSAVRRVTPRRGRGRR